MFTNWLTSSTATTSSSSFSSLAAANMGALPPTVIATPPDIILEVGPSAPSARFVAHSIVLAMHSGYLRSAIRLDENGVPNSELPIYLTNVTPEQFSPLLTYMYTGYLDLNIENIFGVLLATHVLHMPRPLEICRNFLSRMQAEGYLSGAFLSHLNETNNNTNNNNSTSLSSSTTNSSVKVIRPIPSKPTISNLGFIVPPMPHISLPSTGTPFRSLNNQNKSSILTSSSTTTTSSSIIMKSSLSDSHECDNTLSPLQNNHFISSKSITKDSSSILKKSPKLKRPSSIDKSNKRNTNDSSNHHQHHHHNNHQTTSNVSRKESLSSSADNENKIIIDVASCDGPVRFRRVLNDAYGKQPQTIDLLHAHSHERTHQSVSLSFHQQMAKNISQQHHHRQHHHHQQQQHQQNQQHSEESENSEDSSTKNQNISVGGGNGMAGNNSGGEVYNCIYCKHTFKSQYCYQKHAKRHLNPLSLEANDNNCTTTGNSTCNVSAVGGSTVIINHTSSSSSSSPPPPPLPTLPLSSSSDAINDKDEKITQASSTIITSNCSNSGITGDLKREVRPLDMNVQYYPCKTCGSKFPSYYFVHKHRKMCHANEEN